MVNPKIIRSEAKNDYKLLITFANGEQKIFDAAPFLKYSAFEELRGKAEFMKFSIVNGTIEWKCGASLSSDIFYTDSEPVKVSKQSFPIILFISSLIIVIALIIFQQATELILIYPVIINFILFITLATAFIACPKDKTIMIIVFILVLLFGLINIVSIFMQSDKSLYYFQSPSGKNTLIVEEEVVLLSCNVDFYEKKGFAFMKKLPNNPPTNNEFFLFRDKKYKINWVDDYTANITLYTGYNNAQECIVSFNK